jgi:uncharacterized iron-regulated membrane protein
VLGTLAYEDRFSIWARKLHSRLLQDDTWRWMIELAASWMIVMLATGIWLWWPRGHLAAFPRAGMRGRAFWRQWHAFLGVALSLVSLVILATGITWSMYAGEQVRTARDMVGQGPPQAPRNLKSVPAGTALNWQGAWEAARKAAPHISMQLTAPREAEGTWRASNADRSRPTRRFDMQFDAYSGKTLYYSGWDAQTAFGKATAIGIPFHRGEFGWWNQAILLIFGLGLLFSLVSGWVMFFKRRRTGRVGFPSLVPGAWRAASGTFWLAALCLFALLPLLAASAVLVCAAELILHRKQGAWARA